jgi:hypothetical protein
MGANNWPIQFIHTFVCVKSLKTTKNVLKLKTNGEIESNMLFRRKVFVSGLL